MKSDITRDTFDPRQHFSRVIAQQGRVTLDADGNEQAAILLHYLRTLAADLIGPHGGPVTEGGFVLSQDEDSDDLSIGAGRYYVDGILVENHEKCLYRTQPDFPLPDDDPFAAALNSRPEQTFWLYLDVWERHITAIEDDRIREQALGGPDTCSRAKVVWQVKALPVQVRRPQSARRAADLKAERMLLQHQLKQTTDPVRRKEFQAAIRKNTREGAREDPAVDVALVQAGECDEPLRNLTPVSAARMCARVDPGHVKASACVTPPDSKYRGAENQLYRVEVHDGGAVPAATFKWSRDNASVVTRWLGTDGGSLRVATTRGFHAGDWVELTDDILDLRGEPGLLVRLVRVEGGSLAVDEASFSLPDALAWSEAMSNPKVRRWDQTQSEDVVLAGGAVPIVESNSDNVEWIDLEDGIQVQFSSNGVYRTGDYWLIPARVASGRIEWPEVEGSSGTPVATPVAPAGIEHHYAPLGYLSWNEQELTVQSCRCEFTPLPCAEYGYGSRAVAIGPDF